MRPRLVTESGSSAHLRLRVPPGTQHLRAVRLVTADAADRAGLDCEDADDVRIAVDELCHCLMQAGEPIEVAFKVAADCLTVTAGAGPPAAARLAPLGEAVVGAVADAFRVESTDNGGVRFELVKWRRPVPR